MIQTPIPVIKTDVLEFNSKSYRYRSFSNFESIHLFLKDKHWLTVEHYFQAMKFPGDEERQERIRIAKSAAAGVGPAL